MQVARLEEELQRERERGEAVSLKLRQLQHTHIGTALPLFTSVCAYGLTYAGLTYSRPLAATRV